MIEITNITKHFGNVEVLKGVSATIGAAEVVAIVGASGAGKTTLLQIIGTLDRPDSGKVIYEGVDVMALRETELARFRNRNIGFVFQFHRLLPEFNCVENVALPALIGGERQSSAYRRAEELLDYLGLAERRNHKPAQLSGGEQQRVAIARAIAKNPKILLCDEPTGALDYNTGKAILKLLYDTSKSTGKTVIVITHNQAICAMADRVIKIKNGSVSEQRINESPTPVERIEW